MNILVTGISGSGKSELISQNLNLWREITDEQEGQESIHVVSVGQIYTELLKNEFRIPRENVALMEEGVVRAARMYLLDKLGSDFLRLDGKEHMIIDFPLTISRSDGRMVRTFNIDQLKRFVDLVGDIDYVVCMVDSAQTIRERLVAKGSIAHPLDQEKILEWMFQEVTVSEIVSEVLGSRMVVMPFEHSSTNIFKMLYDSVEGNGSSPVAYLAQPISNIKKDAEAKDMINEFRYNLQQHVVVVNPIELVDMEHTPTDYVHTFHRDLYWFLLQSDMVVAYFPKSVVSIGTNRELHEAKIIAKPSVLIHPEMKGGENPFYAKPSDLHCFKTSSDFFDNMDRLPHPFSRMRKGGDPRYGCLKKALKVPQKIQPKLLT